jgi:hypothetical protein
MIPGDYSVNAGPELSEMRDSLFVGSNLRQSRQTVAFQLNKESMIHVVINGIHREDGSGDNWIFEGYIPDSDKSLLVKGYYTTERHIGTLTIY